MKITFNQVKVKGTKRWKDESGKWRQKTKTFWQTISPFNKHPDGAPKTRSEIYESLLKERDAWLNDDKN